MRDDPWGLDEPPAVPTDQVPPLPARLAELAALEDRRPLAPGERIDWPSALELPEVAALVADGWWLLEGPPWSLPAIWPEELRCWVADRLPRIAEQRDGRGGRWMVRTVGEADGLRVEDWEAQEVGLPAPPPGRIWLLRTPWPSLGMGVVRSLILHRCEEEGRPQLPAGLFASAREVLAMTEDEIWTWWRGPEADAARQWRAQGRQGQAAADVVLARLGPADVSALMADVEHGGAGLTEAQAVVWAHAVGRAGGEAVAQIQAYRALGLAGDPPEEEGAWLLREMEPDEVGTWLAAGFTMADASTLWPLPLQTAVAWRDAGFAVDEVRTLLDADPDVSPQEATAFDRAGVSPTERVAWVEAGFDADEARSWRDLDVLPQEARVWRSVGLGPDAARPHRDAGGGSLPPDVAVSWTGFSAERADCRYWVEDPPGTRGRLAREAHDV